jgi:hypothetical protein
VAERPATPQPTPPRPRPDPNPPVAADSCAHAQLGDPGAAPITSGVAGGGAGISLGDVASARRRSPRPTRWRGTCREQRRPRGGGDAGHEHVAGAHPAEVRRAGQDAGRCGDLSGAGAGAAQDVPGLLLRHCGHERLQAVEHGPLGSICGGVTQRCPRHSA